MEGAAARRKTHWPTTSRTRVPAEAPSAVEFVDELPKTSTGKIQKNALREREWAGHGARIKG